MTLEELDKYADDLIRTYKQACRDAEDYYLQMQRAKSDYTRFKSSAENANDQATCQYAKAQAYNAQNRYYENQNYYNAAIGLKTKAENELKKLENMLTAKIKELNKKLESYRQSIPVFEQMANQPLGRDVALKKLKDLKANNEECQKLINALGSILDKVQSALNGGGRGEKVKAAPRW